MKDEAAWNGAAIAAFLIAFVVCLLLLWNTRALYALYGLTFFDLTVIGLATFRTVHLLTFDKIFSFVREACMDLRDGMLVEPEKGFRRMMYELLECLWCTGLWAALIILTLYLLGPVARFIVDLLAVAGVGSFLQLISKRIGSN